MRIGGGPGGGVAGEGEGACALRSSSGSGWRRWSSLSLAIATLKDILLPFVAGIVGAYFLNPLADRLQAYGLKRAWAAILIVGVAAVLLALALVLLVPILVEQVRQLVTALPAETERFKAFIERYGREWLGPSFPSFQTALDKALAEQSQNWAATVAAIMASVWSRGLALVNFVSLLLITPIVVFYLLVDWHPMLERIDQALPRDHASTIRRLAGDINDAVAAFIRGQGAICLVLGIYYAIGLSWAGIEYGLLVGLTHGPPHLHSRSSAGCWGSSRRPASPSCSAGRT